MRRSEVVLCVVLTIAGIGVGFLISYVFSSATYIPQIQESRILYERLTVDYDDLKMDHERLLENHQELKAYADALAAEHRSLKDDLDTLEREHSRLLSDYEDLEKRLEEVTSGAAIAESATWITEDERLKVTSRLIADYSYGALWDYEVEVTVTNISNQPIDVVWIFIFPYEDGKLCEDYSVVLYYDEVKSLYKGESCTVTFDWLPTTMDSYSVLAIGG